MCVVQKLFNRQSDESKNLGNNFYKPESEINAKMLRMCIILSGRINTGYFVLLMLSKS